MAELTDEQIKAEEKFMKGIPRFNVGAFIMPAIWGPAHGIWAAITFYAAFSQRTALSIAIAAIVFVVMVGITVAFALIGQPIAAHRAASRGKTKEEYLASQRVWTVVCLVIGLIAIAAATYYNLVIRPTMGG